MAKKEIKEQDVTELTFEEAIQRLEKVVEQLENGDVPLEQAIQLFEEGMMLAKQCNQTLKQAEQQVEVLMKENGEWIKKPFGSDEEKESP